MIYLNLNNKLFIFIKKNKILLNHKLFILPHDEIKSYGQNNLTYGSLSNTTFCFLAGGAPTLPKSIFEFFNCSDCSNCSETMSFK